MGMGPGMQMMMAPPGAAMMRPEMGMAAAALGGYTMPIDPRAYAPDMYSAPPPADPPASSGRQKRKRKKKDEPEVLY